jgi:hypothetical protein
VAPNAGDGADSAREAELAAVCSVLDIREMPGEVTLRIEFVLRPGHPRYHAPRGAILLRAREADVRGARYIRWLERNEVRSFDATERRIWGISTCCIAKMVDSRQAATGGD